MKAWLICASFALIFVLFCDSLIWALPMIAVAATAMVLGAEDPLSNDLKSLRMPAISNMPGAIEAMITATLAFFAGMATWSILLELLIPAVASNKLAIGRDLTHCLLDEQQILAIGFLAATALAGFAIWPGLRRIAREPKNPLAWIAPVLGTGAAVALVIFGFVIPAAILIGICSEPQFLISTGPGYLSVWLPFVVTAAILSDALWRGFLLSEPRWPDTEVRLKNTLEITQLMGVCLNVLAIVAVATSGGQADLLAHGYCISVNAFMLFQLHRARRIGCDSSGLLALMVFMQSCLAGTASIVVNCGANSVLGPIIATPVMLVFMVKFHQAISAWARLPQRPPLWQRLEDYWSVSPSPAA